MNGIQKYLVNHHVDKNDVASHLILKNIKEYELSADAEIAVFSFGENEGEATCMFYSYKELTELLPFAEDIVKQLKGLGSTVEENGFLFVSLV